MSERELIWILAGEASGDIYGARLAAELGKLSSSARITGMGGPEMAAAGIDIMVDSSELGVVGAVEVIGKIFTFINIFRKLVGRAAAERPDLVVLVDYPGFNIRFAKQMRKLGIPVVWYISPQVWAWRKSNIPKLAAYCAKMMVIFPFEPEVYAETGLEVEFVGHPLVEIVKGRVDPAIGRDPNLLVLLPGSRGGEIKRLLRPMLETVRELHRKRPELRFAIAAPRERIRLMIEAELAASGKTTAGELPEIAVEVGKTGYYLQAAGTGLAASGTITVEAAIAGLPLVVAYRLNPLTFSLARMLIKLFRGFFTMTNIIANKTVYEEFLQFQVVPENLVPALERILPGGERRAEVEADIAAVATALAVGGASPSRRAAEVCLEFLAGRRLDGMGAS